MEKSRNKTVVITGAGGFVGANLTKKLVEQGYSVHIITRPGSSLWRLEKIKKKITVHEGLLADKNKLHATIKKLSPFAVFHLATYGAYPTQQDVHMMIDTNIKGTQHLLDSLKDCQYTQMVVTGSSSEYGKKTRKMKENDFIEPNNTYGATKAAQTHLCQVYAKTFQKPLVIFRLFNVYGPYEEKGRLVRSVIESALTKTPIKLASGKEARDLIYVDDVVDACLYTMKNSSHCGEVFNIGTGRQTTIHELAKKVIRIVGNPVPIQLGVYPGRPWDTYHWKADTKKTKELLGWSAKVSCNEGLRRTIEWYRNIQQICQASNG